MILIRNGSENGTTVCSGKGHYDTRAHGIRIYRRICWHVSTRTVVQGARATAFVGTFLPTACSATNFPLMCLRIARENYKSFGRTAVARPSCTLHYVLQKSSHLVPDIKDFRQTPLLKSKAFPKACTSFVFAQNDTHWAYGNCATLDTQ